MTNPTKETTTPTSSARLDALSDLLARFDRIAIVGGPDTGKTTLSAHAAGRPVVHTDDWKSLPWADVPAAIIAHTAPLARFVIEGVQTARVLRRGLKVDAVIYLDDTHGEGKPTPLTKAVATVFRDWRTDHHDVLVVSPDIHA